MSLYKTFDAKPVGAGQCLPAGSLLDEQLATALYDYRRRTASAYRSLLPEEIPTRLLGEPMFVSPKIDGELWFMVFDGEDVFLSNPKGRLLVGDLPLLKEARKFTHRAALRTVVAGELFAAGRAGGARPRVGDVSASLAKGLDAAVDRLEFAAFDLVQGGDAAQSMPISSYGDKLALLCRLFEGGERVKVVHTEKTTDLSAVTAMFAKWVESGKAEGLVARGESGICKIKPAFTLDAVIIGYTVRAENPNQVRSLALALMRQNQQLQYIGACGNMPEETRTSMLTMLLGSEAPSNWRLTRGDGALFQMVKPLRVLEVKATDVIDAESDGEPLKQMVLTYKDDEGWQAERKLPAASLLFPVFVRLRDDKQVNEIDIRIDQILERCFVPDVDKSAATVLMEKSAVIRREVYKKDSKKGTAVRKLVVWKTNKETADADFPAYVVHFTDYSADRKDPLQREVRPAPDEPSAMRIADAMIADNIKKGWEKVSSGQ
jgi:hypothetical protein